MGVYLPNVDMPKDDKCVTIQICPDGSIWQQYRGTVPNAKAIPIPPHGRLIEADNLLNTAFKLVDEETFRAFRQLVIDATTIIQASEEVYNVYTNTVGNLHWTGTYSGEHIIQLEESE